MNAVDQQLHRLCNISVCLLLLFSVALPSGSFFGIPLKQLSYLGVLVSIFILWLNNTISISHKTLIGISTLIAFTLFFILVGMIRNASYTLLALKEASGFFIAISIFYLVIIAVNDNKLNIDTAIRYIVYGALVFAIWKVLAVYLLVSGTLSFDQLYQFILDKAGYKIVSSGISGGLVRINLIIFDFLVLIILIFMAAAPKAFSHIAYPIRIAFFIIGLTCIVFAFSRLLFLLLAIFWGITFLFQINWQWKVLMLFCFCLLCYMNFESISSMFIQRFMSDGSSASDSIRELQINAMINEWTKYPILGKGFGGFSNEMIRDGASPYSYEVQWVGFFMKLGSLGILYLLIMTCMLTYAIISGHRNQIHYFLLLSLLAFLFGGFTNQYLVNSASGVIYSIHWLIAEKYRLKEPDSHDYSKTSGF